MDRQIDSDRERERERDVVDDDDYIDSPSFYLSLRYI